MEYFDFIINNSPLLVLAFFGFLTFYKGIPFLIKHNDDRHKKTEEAVKTISKKLDGHIAKSSNNTTTIKNDIHHLDDTIREATESIKNIEKHQHTQKGVLATIETLVKSKIL